MLRYQNKLLIILAALFLSSHSLAQECDTIITSKDTSCILFFYNNIDSLALGKLHPINMSLTGFQNYNPLYKSNPFYANLGNIGLVYDNLIFNPYISHIFDFGAHSFDRYLYSNINTEYYHLTDPYSELFYVMGAKKEQLFRLKFHRKIIKNFNVGINARYIFSPGYYDRQKADDKTLALTGQFYTNNSRYGILANYIHNKVYVQENGGIHNDSLFEYNLETDRQLFPVNLTDAENNIKENSFFINQYFNLSPPVSKNPSKITVNLGRITHSYYQIKQIQKYIDYNPASGFYTNIYNDSTETLDSIYLFKIENKLTWSNLGYNDTILTRPFYIYLGIHNRYIELAGYMPKIYFMQWLPAGGFRWNFLKYYHVSVNARYAFGNYIDGDYYGSISIGRRFGTDNNYKGEIAINAEITRQAPPYFCQHYESNNFRWNNSFSKQNYQKAGLSYHLRRLKVGFDYCQINNFVYFDAAAIPRQENNSFNVIKAFLYKDFQLGKFGILNKLVYQASSNKDVLRLPEFMAYVSFIFTTPVFNHAAIIQPGIDVFYNTDYFANAYMPALRSFYLQNEKEIGNYFYIDIYFMLRIKRARLFLKYRNITSLFGDYRYYTVPHYPMQDAAFKFGVSWKFFD
jgi:hypothetical protein